MSVTAPRGFRAAGVAAGTRDGRARDVAVVINDGPSRAAAAVFTPDDSAAPVLWSRQVASGHRVRAAVLASGGANAGAGPLGFQDVHAQAEHAAGELDDSAAEIVVCACGDPGTRPPLDSLRRGTAEAVAEASRGGGLAAADALRTTDTVAKIVFRRGDGYTIGAMAKGPDPSVSSVLAVLTTDADLTGPQCERLLAPAVAKAFAPLGATNDTVLLMASGAAGTVPDEEGFAALLTDVCADLAAQIAADPSTPAHSHDPAEGP